MARIMIFGGHGKVARLLEPLLVARGDTVTAVIRNPEHEREVAETGATPVVADIETFDLDQLTNFVSGNDADAKRLVESILREWFGWKNIIDLGDITTARGTEQWLALWVRLYGSFKSPAFNLKIVR